MSAAAAVVSLCTFFVTVTIFVQSDNRAFASADDADDGDIDQSAAAKPAPVRSAAAGRIACRGGSAAGMAVSGKGHRDAASRQAEMRAKKLADEAEVTRGGWNETCRGI